MIDISNCRRHREKQLMSRFLISIGSERCGQVVGVVQPPLGDGDARRQRRNPPAPPAAAAAAPAAPAAAATPPVEKLGQGSIETHWNETMERGNDAIETGGVGVDWATGPRFGDAADVTPPARRRLPAHGRQPRPPVAPPATAATTAAAAATTAAAAAAAAAVWKLLER